MSMGRMTVKGRWRSVPSPCERLLGILGMLEISDRCADDPDQVRKYHAKIHKASDYLRSLVNDVLDMNRLDDEKMVFPKDSVDLYGVMQDCRELLSTKAQEKNIQLVIPAAEQFDPPRIISSELHLRQVFMTCWAMHFSLASPTAPSRWTAGFLPRPQTP